LNELVDLQYWLARAAEAVNDWQQGFGGVEPHESSQVSDARLAPAFDELTTRLRDNYPFFHPCYAGQMLKPPHPAAVVGYLAAMLINPNNHALDGGPATAAMEREVVSHLAAMFGFGEQHLGHLTSSGTIANLEALYVARELHPGQGIAYSSEAHYTHERMCRVLGIDGHQVGVDGTGRMDLAALAAVLASGRVGTVVATAGTTALGAVDQVHQVLAIARRHGARVHVDAAYGGFFTVLAGRHGIAAEPWQAISDCDSVVVDPHKHGLQPYGCGAIIFADPDVGRFYLHDSPYTYFTSGDLHLGEISLECSRAGAAAAALWLTFQVLPPTRDGLGQLLAAGRRAALAWAELLGAQTGALRLYQQPELDIVTYFPARDSLSAIDAASAGVLRDGMTDPAEPVFVSTLRVAAEAFRRRHPEVIVDSTGARVVRSVLMKPESEPYIPTLHSRLDRLARSL
jgi:glutamate/tyrosine decarboxylase-like PLP-dependent enzyme